MTVESELRDFTPANLKDLLTKEIMNTEPRVLEVCQQEPIDSFSERYLLSAATGDEQYFIYIGLSPEKDSFYIHTALMGDFPDDDPEVDRELLDWWREYLDNGDEEKTPLYFSRTPNDFLILRYEGEASDFYLELIEDLIIDILDVVPDCLEVLEEIFETEES